jgi:exopolysaccharide biosynthesis polyprenyl glycosylphosphotransferase
MSPSEAFVPVTQGDFSIYAGDGVAPALSDRRSRSEALQRTFGGSPWWRDVLLRRMLAAADVFAALLVSLSLWLGSVGPRAACLTALAAPVWVLLAKLHGLYDRDQRGLRILTVDELPRLCLWALSCTTGITMLLVALHPSHITLAAIAVTWIVACGSAIALRVTARWLWRHITPPERTVILGGGPLAAAAARKLTLFGDIHLEIVHQCGLDHLGALRTTLRRHRIERIILASESIGESTIAGLLSTSRRERVKLSVVPPVSAMLGTAVQLDNIAALPFLQYNTWDVSRSTLLLKRALDLFVSVIAIVVLLPVAALLAVAIRLDAPGPIIFGQLRAGRGGRPFRMFKFRTMIDGAEDMLAELVPFDELDEPMFKLRDDPRVTRVGRVLRRTSLDELPQLFNVLRGEMSLVGPRPEQVDLVERYSPEERVRLAVKPGLTGPMQISGRGELTLDERVTVEREYIENLTLGRDLRILVMTMSAVLGARGAY